jgi:hypothetical protein
MSRIAALVSAIIFIAVPWHEPLGAQASNRVFAFVESSADDQVGRNLTFETREAIRRSAGFALADREEDARLLVRLVTSDPDKEGSSGLRTIYAVAYTFRTTGTQPVEWFLSQSVGICGRERTESCARTLVAGLDELAISLRGLLRSGSTKPGKPK